MASIVYIARDIERALGKEPIGDYHIITNKNPYSIEIQKKHSDNVFLIESTNILDTIELLSDKSTLEIIDKLKAKVSVFKNTNQIEKFCLENKIELLNPKAGLAEKIENKITQIEWLNELSNLLPPHKILIAKDIEWRKKPFILQWSHGHTGDGTLLINNENDLNKIKEKFPNREARITDFIKGPMFTVNIVVTDTINLLGNISYQITGILPFTENPFSTIGNDWSLPHSYLTESQIIDFENIAEKVAKKMQDSGWKGLFGIDVIYDEERDSLHLIEINARQPASTSFESQLQNNYNLKGLTTFDAHLKALSNGKIDDSLIQINDGSQIIQRVTNSIKDIDITEIVNAGYNVIKYSNKEFGNDLVRIQSDRGIMETHNKFNKRGKQILDLIKPI